MGASHSTSVEGQEKIAQVKAAKLASAFGDPNTNQDQLSYLLEATLRIEKSLANLTQYQASLERIIETKFYDIDMKVTKIQTAVEKLKEDAKDRYTTNAFQRVLRGPRSSAVPVDEPRLKLSAPAATITVVPPVSTTLVP